MAFRERFPDALTHQFEQVSEMAARRRNRGRTQTKTRGAGEAMAYKKPNETHSLNLPVGLYLADNYMQMADRAIKNLAAGEAPEGGPVFLAISSFAFAVEVYFKSIVFVAEKKTLQGHHLERLWDKLPEVARTWLSVNFDANYKSTGKDWGVILVFGPFSAGVSEQASIRTPNACARDMVYGHRRAFEVGRYGHELPAPRKVKPILHNIRGLQLFSWLTRALAYQYSEQREILSKVPDQPTGRRNVTFPLPTSVSPYPDDATVALDVVAHPEGRPDGPPRA